MSVERVQLCPLGS
uniref:Uncharacterized protein n=1 Tax=Anguilla anguilla TaxID=7936 RepID=A0A0E9VPS0_ANGAN